MMLLPWTEHCQWVEANHSVTKLIERHCQSQSKIVLLAEQLRIHLETINPLMDRLCQVTCRFCAEPCCLTAWAGFDFKDLLFLHLSGQPIPISQTRFNQHKPCRYIGVSGCRLPRLSRPWICTWYLCPTQMSRLRKKSQPIQKNYKQMMYLIKKVRADIEEAVLQMAM